MKFLIAIFSALILLVVSFQEAFAYNYDELFVKKRILEITKNNQTSSFSNLNIEGLTNVSVPKKFRAPILMYHYIGPRNDPTDATRSALSTWPQILESQIKTLKEANFTFLTNAELSDYIESNKELPEKSVVLTFDDSYKDFYINAYPIVKTFNVKATIYVITSLLNHPNHLSVDELLELSSDPNIEIAAHTVHHEWLKDQSPEIDEFEIKYGKKYLEELIKKEVVSFAYPYGAFDDRAVEVVKQAGYKSAVSTLPGINQSIFNKFVMYRLRPGERIGEDLLNWLSQEKFLDF